MTTINATWFQTLMSDASIAAATAETVIQQAIDSLNTFGAGISDLSGAAGSKTLAATSAQAGAIGLMAREVYSKLHKNADGANVGIGGLNVAYSGDSQLLNFARQLANELKGRDFRRA